MYLSNIYIYIYMYIHSRIYKETTEALTSM